MKVLHVFTIIGTPKAFFDGQFRYLSAKGQEIHVVSDSPEDLEFSRRNSVKYYQVPIVRKFNPFTDLSSIKNLIKLIRKEKYDIVVGHTPKGAMVSMIAAKIARVNTRIYYRHGLIYTTAKGFKRIILKTVEQFTAAFSTHIVNVSFSLSKLAINDHLNSDRKQNVIGSGTCGGIDTAALFNPEFIHESESKILKASLGISKDDFVVGFCGRVCKEKGIRELIDGFNRFMLNNPKSKLLLIGPFDNRDILPDKYKIEIESNPNIISTGKIDKSRLPLYYSLMDVFVFPSYREGFGMCVIEASAMKIPILVSRSHGCVDSIREHQTGEYVDISDIGILRGLEKMKNGKFRKLLGEEGRKFVVDNFENKIMWPKILNMYNNVIKN